jgi:hypothetical protein
MCVCRLKVCVCSRRACPLLPHLCQTMFSGGRRGVPTQGLLVSLLSLDASVLPHSGSLRLLLSLVIDMLFVALWSPLRTGLRSGDLYRGCDVTKAGRVPTGLCDIFETSEVVPDVDSSLQATGFFFYCNLQNRPFNNSNGNHWNMNITLIQKVDKNTLVFTKIQDSRCFIYPEGNYCATVTIQRWESNTGLESK